MECLLHSDRLHQFVELAADGNARLGMYHTAHGSFSTPNFMPVGSRGSVKGVDAERISEVGAEIILVNAYHLLVRPGPNVVRALGGIHAFSGWKGSILSDSGGFQVFSLKGLRKVTEDGVEFRSHLDGSKLFLSPERSMEVQEELGVDIAMVLDECPAGDMSYEAMEQSLLMTNRWAARSLGARRNPSTAVFGITQGGAFRDLRTRSAEAIFSIGFDGVAIGGLSVGEPQETMYEVLDYHVSQLPRSKIRYLMGVGTPEDIAVAVSHGVDLFDCVIPTRAGRFGRAFVRGDAPFINIRNSHHESSNLPLDESCSCLACRHYSRGYLNHLFKAAEMLGPQLLTIHNLTHYFEFMRSIREAIGQGSFGTLLERERRRWKGQRRVDEIQPE